MTRPMTIAIGTFPTDKLSKCWPVTAKKCHNRMLPCVYPQLPACHCQNFITNCYPVSTPITGLSLPNCHIAACHCQNVITDCYLGLPQLPACHCQIAALRPVIAKMPRPIVKSYLAELPNCHIAACHLPIAK